MCVHTAHVLQSLLGPSACSSLLFGDGVAEGVLLDQLCAEINEDMPSTVILYPTPTAASLGDWIQQRPPTCRQAGLGVRVVVLDGTYNQANRQWKYLTKALAQYQFQVRFFFL